MYWLRARRVDNNVAVGGGWLATRVRFLDYGVAAQSEDYSNWRTDVSFPEGFFQPEHWADGQHRARPAAP